MNVYSQLDLKNIIEQRENGKSFSQIGKAYGVSKQRIHQVLSGRGINRPTPVQSEIKKLREAGHIWCSRCRKIDPPRYAKNGDSITCNECNTKRSKEYRKTPGGRASVLNSVKRYGAKNPERVSAWIMARQLPPEACVVCGETAHKHHPDPAKPLSVVYLCPYHHKQTHMGRLDVSLFIV